jgi:hypothetical protein
MASAQNDILSSELSTLSLDKKEIVCPFSFDMNYRGDELQQKVCRILGLDSAKGWSIIDTFESLVLIHYNDSADAYEQGHLRGILVDTESECVLSDSFGYTPSCVYHALPLPTPVNDGQTTKEVINIMDENQVFHQFDTSKVSIKRAFEGVVLRCLWYKGKFLQITHKKINTQRSRWGTPKTFLQMYQEAGGPTVEQLFDTSKPSSSTVYTFIVVDTPLLISTRQIVNKPYLVFVEAKEFDLKCPEDQVAKGKPISGTSEIGAIVNESMIHIPRELSIAEANDFLQKGYHAPHSHFDIRQYNGESIILCQEINGKKQTVKVNSLSYDWRIRLRGNNPNVVNQFYHLLSSVYEDFNENSFFDFLGCYIPFPLYDQSTLKLFYEGYPNSQLPVADTISHQNYPTRDDRIQLLFINYWFSLPHTNQLQALTIFDDYKNDREALCKWLNNIHKTVQNLDSTELCYRIKDIIKFCRNSSSQDVRTNKNYTKEGKFVPYEQLVKNKIRNIICKEKGSSLYSLVKIMKTPPPADQ